MKPLVLGIILFLLASAACKQMSHEDALAISQDFVNSRVRTYVSENGSKEPIQHVQITIVEAVRNKDRWYVTLAMQSPKTNKSSGLMLTIDQKTREVIGIKPFNLTDGYP